MSEGFTRPHGVPSEATRQQQRQQEPPDFLMHAGHHLAAVAKTVNRMAEADQSPATTDKVIELRLKLAAAYTELAAIQYGLPDEGDEGYLDDAGAR